MRKTTSRNEQALLRDIALKIRSYMLLNNVSYNTIGKLASVNPGTVSRLVRKREGINIINLARICKACDISLSAALAERGL